MIGRSIAAALCISCIAGLANGQAEGIPYQDDATGIAFVAPRPVEKTDGATYRITVVTPGSASGQTSFMQVAETDRLFIDLPGSYGGKLYLDRPAATTLKENKILVDSVTTDYMSYRREYWAVYAGMGMWDCVVNCSSQNNGRYYLVSLIQSLPIGKPGEEVGGRQLDGEGLKEKALASLRDSTNDVVQEFNALLGSFRVQRVR